MYILTLYMFKIIGILKTEFIIIGNAKSRH